jgi:hypothetical protein
LLQPQTPGGKFSSERRSTESKRLEFLRIEINQTNLSQKSIQILCFSLDLVATFQEHYDTFSAFSLSISPADEQEVQEPVQENIPK